MTRVNTLEDSVNCLLDFMMERGESIADIDPIVEATKRVLGPRMAEIQAELSACDATGMVELTGDIYWLNVQLIALEVYKWWSTRM
jgi:hypothetical protein